MNFKLKKKQFSYNSELDIDGSGEVNVDELQDPLLSTGILKTRYCTYLYLRKIVKSFAFFALRREQVIRVVSNSDTSGTMGQFRRIFVNSKPVIDSLQWLCCRDKLPGVRDCP